MVEPHTRAAIRWPNATASNFVPYTPRKEPGPNDNWLGKRLFSSDYQTWCHADGTQLVCRPKRTWLTAKGA